MKNSTNNGDKLQTTSQSKRNSVMEKTIIDETMVDKPIITSNVNTTERDGSGSWKVVNRKGKYVLDSDSAKSDVNQGNRSSNSKYTRQKKFVVGSGEVMSNLKTVDRKEFLFVSRISPDIGSEDVKSFLNDIKKCADVTVEKLASRYPDVYSSFKVGLPSSIIKEAFSSQFWPKGTFINKYYSKKNNLNLKTKQSLEIK